MDELFLGIMEKYVKVAKKVELKLPTTNKL